MFLLDSAINNGGATSTTLYNRLFLAKIMPIRMHSAPIFRQLSVITAGKIEDLKRILSTKVSQALAVKLLGSDSKIDGADRKHAR